MPSNWLPELITLAEYEGKWDDYIEAVYQRFVSDFLDSKPNFPGKRFALKRHPLEKGKEATFWHLVSTGKKEEERNIDLRRCERIGWPRVMIEAMETENVYAWKNKRKGSERIVIALYDFSYVVIIDEREDFVLLWTAYCVQQKHRRKKLQNEYQRYKDDSVNS